MSSSDEEAQVLGASSFKAPVTPLGDDSEPADQASSESSHDEAFNLALEEEDDEEPIDQAHF